MGCINSKPKLDNTAQFEAHVNPNGGKRSQGRHEESKPEEKTKPRERKVKEEVKQSKEASISSKSKDRKRKKEPALILGAAGVAGQRTQYADDDQLPIVAVLPADTSTGLSCIKALCNITPQPCKVRAFFHKSESSVVSSMTELMSGLQKVPIDVGIFFFFQ